jgi:ABC-type dipeptide/oligopeptide/nickel transport system permease component
VQFGTWLWSVLRLDFGTSLWNRPAGHREVLIRLPLSLEVAILATIVSVAARDPAGHDRGGPPGHLGGLRHPDPEHRGQAIPSFWVGILVILFLVIYFGWGPPLEFTPPWVTPGPTSSSSSGRWLTVGYRYAAVTTPDDRSTCSRCLREDYIRTAWAKGLRQRAVVIAHALKNAMLPVITLVGTEFAFLIGGPGGDRDGLHAQRSRPLRGRRGRPPRLPGGAGPRVPDRPLLRGREPADRSHLRVVRTRASGITEMAIDSSLLRLVHDRDPGAARTVAGAVVGSSAPSRSARRRGDHLWHAGAGRVRRAARALRSVPGDYGCSSRGPNAEHWFGTDEFGRDVLSRIMYGARIALFVGFTGLVTGCTLGGLLGVISAYWAARSISCSSG